MIEVDVPLVLVVLGGVLIILGLAGGGIKTKWVEVPSQIGKGVRVTSVIFGILCVAAGGSLFFYEKAAPGTRAPAIDGGGKPPAGTGVEKTALGAGGESGNLRVRSFEISGRAVDVFDNPREGVIVLVRGLQRYGISDEKGRYILVDVPFQKGLTLDAFYGGERDNLIVNLELAAPGETLSLPEPLVLNPLRVEVVLCRYVEQSGQEGLKPVDIFEGEEPRVAYDSLRPSPAGEGREVWCFIKVFGPDRYEAGRRTDLSFEWEWGGEVQGRPYTQPVGIRSFGWRTRVSKRVWEGEWTLKIMARHAELARISFEVY